MSKTFVPLHFWPSREIPVPGLLDTMSSFLQPGILNPNGQPLEQDLFITLKVARDFIRKIHTILCVYNTYFSCPFLELSTTKRVVKSAGLIALLRTSLQFKRYSHLDKSYLERKMRI